MRFCGPPSKHERESIATFPERWKEAEAYLNTINSLQKEQRYEDVAHLMPHHMHAALKGADHLLGDLSRAVREITHAPAMTADEKRRYIDTLYYQGMPGARDGNDMYDKMQPMIKEGKECSRLEADFAGAF